MLVKRHRFHGHNSLNHVYRHGRTVRGTFAALKVVRNDRRDSYRLAVVVSRKIHKSAVTRNRLRRRIYEVVRVHEAQITEPFDMVLTVYSEQMVELPSDKLSETVGQLLRSAGVLTNGPDDAARGIIDKKET